MSPYRFVRVIIVDDPRILILGRRRAAEGDEQTLERGGASVQEIFARREQAAGEESERGDAVKARF